MSLKFLTRNRRLTQKMRNTIRRSQLNMIEVLLIMSLLSFVVLMAIWSRALSETLEYAKKHDLKIMECRYDNSFQMYSNIMFLNSIWSYGFRSRAEDSTLHDKLVRVSSIFRKGVYSWLVFVLLFLTSAFTHQN